MEQIRKKTVLANLALWGTAIIWGYGFLAGKSALTGFSPFTVLTFRFLGSAVFICIIFFKSFQHFTPQCCKYGMILGFLQFVAQALQLIGLQYTTPGKQAFLVASYVVFVPFLAWLLLRQTPRRKDLFSAVLTIWGLALISLQGDLSINLGDCLSIGHAVVFAVQIVLLERFIQQSNPVQITFFQCLCAGIFSALAAFFTEPAPVFAWNEALGGVAYLILFNTVAATLLQNFGQKYTSGSSAAVILSMQSVFGFLFSAVFSQEPVTDRILLGCFLVFFAALFSKLNLREFRAAVFFRR